jgi:hypothetical protein
MTGFHAARACLVALIGLMSVAAASPGHAQTFACSEATAGQLSVQAEVQCECRFFTASRLAGTAAGYRWDCGILRARMNQEVPATSNPYPIRCPTRCRWIGRSSGTIGARPTCCLPSGWRPG